MSGNEHVSLIQVETVDRLPQNPYMIPANITEFTSIWIPLKIAAKVTANRFAT